MATILVVDDEEDMRQGMILTLQSQGFSTLEADNGVSALELIKKHLPQLIISDVMMPNMNGYMLLEMLKEDTRTSKIPVMLITGAAFDSGAWKADDSVAYLEKPFETEKFLEIVEKMLK